MLFQMYISAWKQKQNSLMGLTYPNTEIIAVVKTSFLHTDCMQTHTMKSQLSRVLQFFRGEIINSACQYKQKKLI